MQTIKSVMFGGSPYGIEMDFSFPLLPWCGISLAGSAVGGWLQRVGPDGMWRVSRRLLLFAGTALLLLGFLFSQPQRSWVKNCRRWLEPIGINAPPIPASPQLMTVGPVRKSAA